MARLRWRTSLLAVLFVLVAANAISSFPDVFGFAGRRRFRKEWKCRVGHAMHDTVVMTAIGQEVGLAVYYFQDDFRHFFYQIVLASRCLWYSGIFIYDPETGLGAFVLELVREVLCAARFCFSG